MESLRVYDGVDMKRCCHCKEWKEEAWFGFNKARADGMSHFCKQCARAAAKKTYEKNMKKKKFRKERAEKACEYRAKLRGEDPSLRNQPKRIGRPPKKKP